ncbi:HEPN-associated N-terminal domain-containing protein [Flavobacterium sp.]|uniref:HEPN-associated N-terminal domain-containing protein n=1 Tax=Flavobacterium sp. TaxID=239 RepID=UPI0026136DF1|nr:HEPN-associated N-terminal domain-containing protein [Flavobacterium sp.]
MKSNKKPGDHFDNELYDLDTTEFVCANHIEDDFISKQIRKKGIKGKCDYCQKNRVVVELSEVLKLIINGIDYLFEDPGNSRYLNKEGLHGFDGDTFDFYDLWYEDKLGLGITNDQLFEDVYGYLSNDTLYCAKDEFYSESEDLESLWGQFKETVKYKARFVFYFKEVFKGYQYEDPYEILKRIQKSILKFNLITDLPQDTILYRARQHGKNGDITKASELASAPQHLAKAYGRMNPSGISMFYCSRDRNLTIAEVVNKDLKDKPLVTTGVFRNKKDLRLVDLSDIPDLSSIFDEKENTDRETLLFLKGFVNDITKPIDANDSIIDYIPTQIVTEYIKFNPKLNVDGIIYPSSKVPGVKNIVIFYNHEESLEHLSFKVSSLKTEKI